MKMLMKAAMAMSWMVASAPAAYAATFVIEFNEAESWGHLGDERNTVIRSVLAPNARITGISYNFSLSVLDPGWLLEQRLEFGDAYDYFVKFEPAIGEDRPGTETYNGSADLKDMAMDFFLLDDGVLNIEFVNAWPHDKSAKWTNGSFTINYDTLSSVVPEPATWAMMIIGFGLIGAATRRSAIRWAPLSSWTRPITLA